MHSFWKPEEIPSRTLAPGVTAKIAAALREDGDETARPLLTRPLLIERNQDCGLDTARRLERNGVLRSKQ